MCGITGFQGFFDRDLLRSMTAVLAHRGPDGEGEAMLGDPGPTRTGLGHRRLAIIDLSAQGAQPMSVECDACGALGLDALALTYNGEVYNFRELRSELERRGHRFKSQTDSEVLLHLYAEEGTKMVSRLNGIFAFAIRDGRPSGQEPGMEPGDLFLARDQVGVKPLYYAETKAGFLFGSEMKAVLQSPDVCRAIDHTALHYHLAYLWCPAPSTMIEQVRKLEPGFGMVVRGGRVARRWAYYDLPYNGHRDTRGVPEIADDLRHRLDTAVKRQLVSDVPVGAFLSGGLDSTSVVAAMRHAGSDPLCFGVGFGPAYHGQENPDDLPYGRIAAKHLGVRLVELVIEPGMIRDLDRMLYYLDEPQADLAPINALLIAGQAREHGIKVLLSGAGGDDIFAGYRRHRAVEFERWWGSWPRSLRSATARAARWTASGGGAAPMHGAMFRRLVKMFSFADLEGDERLASYFWWSPEGVRWALYSPVVRERLATTRTAAPLLDSLRRIPNEPDPLSRVLYLEAKHFLADHNLNYTDRMGMAHGVEIRVPLLDTDLIALATSIPSRLKYRGAVSKAIFRLAMEQTLPKAILSRPKSGFGVPLRTWMRTELRDIVDDTLSPAVIKQRGLFDNATVQRLAELDRRGTVDGSYTLLALVCIELWCRLFVDQVPREAPAGVYSA